MNVAALRAELARIDARLEELDRAPRPARDVAREATELALRELSGRTAMKRVDLRFSTIDKLLSDGKRLVRGVASSASVDRVGDIVVPAGGKWKLPVPLLWQHRHDEPIGWVRSLTVKGDQLLVEAEFARGVGRADEAWSMVEAQLVDSFSIGFRALPGGTEVLPSGGIRFTKWELYELSVVTIPANSDAKIQRSSASLKLQDPLKNGAVRLHRPELPVVKLLTPAEIAKAKRAGAVPLVKRADGAIELKPLPVAQHAGAVPLLRGD